jgi:hypothetical protein
MQQTLGSFFFYWNCSYTKNDSSNRFEDMNEEDDTIGNDDILFNI